MKVQNSNSVDTLMVPKTTPSVSGSGKRKNDFKQLLDNVRQGAETGRPKTKAGRQKTAQPSEAAQTEENGATMLAAEAQATQMAQSASQAQPEGETEVSSAQTTAAGPVFQTVQPLQMALPTQMRQETEGQASIAQEPLAASTQTAARAPVDSASANVYREQAVSSGRGQDAQDAQTQNTQTQSAQTQSTQTQSTQTQSTNRTRFDAMLGQARQELQGRMTVPPETEDTLPVEEITEESVLPEELPEVEPDQPVEDQTDQVVDEQTEAEAETKTPAQQTPAAQVQEQPKTSRTAEQRPLTEIPESDRIVMELVDTKRARERDSASAVAAPETKAEPVRVENTAKAEPAQPARPVSHTDQAEQIRVEAVQNLEQGKMEFRMQLEPEELGKVDVRMVLESGKLAVEIIAASPKAAELLRGQAEGLAQSLRMQQIDVQAINIVTETQAPGSHMSGAFNMLNGQAQEGGDGNRNTSGEPGSGGSGQQDNQTAEQMRQQQARSPEALLDYTV